jgi:hypothetical protein
VVLEIDVCSIVEEVRYLGEVVRMLMGYQETVATKEWTEVVSEVTAGANQPGEGLNVREFWWSS